MPEFILNTDNAPAPYDELSTFAKGFVECMFFSNIASGIEMAEWFEPAKQDDISEGSADGCLPSDCGVEQLHPDSIAAIAEFCAGFEAKAADLLEQAYSRDYSIEQAGRDLYFTYEGAGVGYGDRDVLEGNGQDYDAAEYDRLTAIMRAENTSNRLWSECLAKCKAMQGPGLGDQLTEAAGSGEFQVWFGDHTEHGNAPFVYFAA